jgi:hypothetical protein
MMLIRNQAQPSSDHHQSEAPNIAYVSLTSPELDPIPRCAWWPSHNPFFTEIKIIGLLHCQFACAIWRIKSLVCNADIVRGP